MNRATYQQAVRDVDWKQLPGAYGSDYALDEDLIAAASADEQSAYESLGKVLAHVCHQNVLAAPAPEAAACLLRISEIEEPTHPWVGLFGVTYLLASARHIPREFGFPRKLMSFAGELPPPSLEDRAWQEADDALSLRLVEVVEARTGRLCELLEHSDSRTRAQSARLLAVGRCGGSSVLHAVATAYDREADDAARAGLLLALACRLSLEFGTKAELIERMQRAVTSNAMLESIGAAVALLLVEPAECIARHAAVIRAGLRFESDEAPYLFLRKFPWSYGSVPDLAAEALVQAAVPDAQAVELMMEAVLHWACRTEEPKFVTEWQEQDQIAMRIAQRVFQGHLGRRDYLQVSDLTPLQRSVAARLAPLPIEGAVFDAYGFRNLARDAERLLGRITGGLDEPYEATWEGRVVRWPVWKWWHQCALMDRWTGRANVTDARDRLLSQMKKQLPPSAIFRAAEDAVSGAYEVPHAPFVRLAAAVSDSIVPLLEKYIATVGPHSNGPIVSLAVLPSLVLAAGGRRVPWLELVRLWIDRITPLDLKAEAMELAQRC